MKEMSRQVDWSNDPACVGDEGGAVSGDEADAWELEDGVWLDEEADGDVPFEHPLVTIAMATTPANVVRSSRIGGSSVPRIMFAACTLPAIRIGPARF
ncbi:hypothetical protein ABW17_27420 [Mycobacterium nebraskense]|nr:hypothetical protein ABW17_27420 [Mycobacterium nebraskense]